MHDLKHPCRIPADDEMAIISSDEPGTAIRVRRLPSDGQVILEQLSHSNSSGWYVQKSFSIPETMMSAVLREMRKADCLAHRPQRPTMPTCHMRLRLD